MKKILLLLFAAFALQSASAQIIYTAGINHMTGVVTTPPTATGSRVRLNMLTGEFYQWNPTLMTWIKAGSGIDKILGGIAPAYTPGIAQSLFAINDSSDLYHYNGTTWDCINCGGGSTYTAGTGIAISGGNVISNTLPSKWADVGATTYLIDSTDNVAIGTASANSKLEIRKNNIGQTQTNSSGLLLSTTTPAINGGQQYSPALRFRANGWKATSPAASQPVDFRIYAAPVQTLSEASGSLEFMGANNIGTYMSLMSLGSNGRPTTITKAGTTSTGLIEMIEDGNIRVSSTNNSTGSYSDFRADYGSTKFRTFDDVTNYSLFEQNIDGFENALLRDDRSGTFALRSSGLEIGSTNTTTGSGSLFQITETDGLKLDSYNPSGHFTIETRESGAGALKMDLQANYSSSSHINKIEFREDSTRISVGNAGKPTYIGIGQSSLTIGNDALGGDNYVKYDAIDPYNYLKYTADKSSDIILDDRAIPDVGTVKNIVAAGAGSGVAILTSGYVFVSAPSIAPGDKVIVSCAKVITAQGILSADPDEYNIGVGFVIRSSTIADDSLVNWFIAK